MKLSYGNYEITEEERRNKLAGENEKIKLRQEMIKQHVDKHGYAKLKSNYFGMDSYYYDNATKVMYKVHNTIGFGESIQPTFEISHDENILRLNNLL